MSLAEVRARIEKSCRAAGRSPADVSLIAVSKFQPPEKVEDILRQGHRLFGENRIQEALERWPAFKEKYEDIRLHFIGHLQTNKAREAVAFFDVIETLDSIRLADTLANEMQKQKRVVPCFIQVNTGEEPQKGGISPRDLETLFRHAREIAGITIEGLMCIPPEGDIPDMHFALLHKLSLELGLEKRSMGMSSDYEIAIRYGATHLRIGSALFGARST